jgi:ATP-binding cassette, subfamily B, bacterial
MNNSKLGWRERVRSWRNAVPLLRIVWKSSPALLLASLFLRIVRACLPLGLLWVPKLILDAIIKFSLHGSGSMSTIWKLVALEFALAVANDILGRLNVLCENLLGDRFTNLLNLELMHHAGRLDLASFEDPLFYDKLERARTQSSGRLALFVSILTVGQDALTLIALSAGLVVYSPWLIPLLVGAIIPAFLGEGHLTALAYSVLYRSTPQRRQLDYLRFLGAASQTIKEVKVFGLQEHLEGKYEEVAKRIYEENTRVAVKRASMGSLLNLISTLGYYGGYVLVVLRVVTGAISIGTFTFLVGAFSRSRTSVERIGSSLNDISEQTVLLNDLFDFFKMQPSIYSPPRPLAVPNTIRKGFEFRGVTFTYPGSDRPVLRQINFELCRGEKLALIGENGAGKTTIVKLLARLYDPTAGQILLDGVDLREYDLDGLRRLVGVIFQDFVHYDMLVRDNIGFGNIDFLRDQKRVEKAGRKSGADEFIRHFPARYLQLLGRRFEGGVELSGGEWQKIALARAYMRDAQLLVLDEPTASLDARAEYEVFCHFANLMRDRMALLISHRFSTVRMADRILVLANGKVQEEGTHEQLLAMDGHYAELFELQASGYR